MVKVGQADAEYKRVIELILENGEPDDPEKVRPVYEDGTKATTVSYLNPQMKYDNSGDEALLLTTKKAPRKDPIKETRWMWQMMSNKVQELRDMGCTVWDEWENKKGIIGKAYGWQLANKKRKVVADKLLIDMLMAGQFSWMSKEQADSTGRENIEAELLGKKVKLNQVDYLLYQLKKNPHSRRIKTTLYCIEDLDDMELEPCVYETWWKVWKGKLCLTVNIRSNDMALTLVPSVRNGCRKTLLKRETLIA